MKKKIVALLLVVSMLAVAIVSGTLAYFTDTGEAVNVFTIGNIDIELTEDVTVTNGKGGDEVPGKVVSTENGKSFSNIVPGNYMKKEVTVTNVEKNPAYVRVVVVVNNYDKINNAIDEWYEKDDADSYTVDGKTMDDAKYIQYMYDTVFDGWGINYKQNTADNPIEGFPSIRRTISKDYVADKTTTTADVLAVDTTYRTTSDSLFSEYNTFKSEAEKINATGNIVNPENAYYGKILNQYELCYAYYFYMEEGEAVTLFNGLLCPGAEFGNEQSKMFEDLQIEVYADAIQAEGFNNLDEAIAALEQAHPLTSLRTLLPEYVTVTPENIDSTDFTASGVAFLFQGDFGEITLSEIGEGSTLTFDNVTATSIAINDDAVITGENKLASAITSTRNGNDSVSLTVKDATLDMSGSIEVKNTDGKSILTIENSTVKTSTIFVGEHSNNCPNALAELNVINSFVSCEENAMGSTIAVWGASGVDAKIYDSEIHTYSRGWHQSEDANDNSLTFQGTDYINVDIQRSNMHLYGARSIINARAYGGTPAINATIDDSLIWVVTKSSHGETTLPVWGFTNITDSALIFTKNVYQDTPVAIKTDVYGNPVIHGNYAVTTQCGWETDIPLADGQTVTIAKDANVSIYEGAAEVNFVLEGTAKVVVEAGASLTNIGVVAADGYTLNTTTNNGVTTYSVSAKPVYNDTELADAIASGEKTIHLADGTYEMSTSANDLTFIGASEAGTKINYTIQHSGVSQGSIWRKSNFKNLTFTNTVFTMAEGGNSTFTNVTFAAGFRNGYGSGVVFTDCTFGSNSEGYALHFQSDANSEGGVITLTGCEFEGGKVHLGSKRSYVFTGCDFAAGTDFQVWSNITIENCTVDGVAVTADNIKTLFPDLDMSKVTLK